MFLRVIHCITVNMTLHNIWVAEMYTSLNNSLLLMSKTCQIKHRIQI